MAKERRSSQVLVLWDEQGELEGWGRGRPLPRAQSDHSGHGRGPDLTGPCWMPGTVLGIWYKLSRETQHTGRRLGRVRNPIG